MFRPIVSLLTFAAFLAVLFVVSLCVFQDKLIFVPCVDGPNASPYGNPPGWRHPGEKGIPYEDVYIDTEEGVKLHSWLMKNKNSRICPTIVFFHGNAGNLGHRLPNYELMYRRLNANLVAVSYRGYGVSTGVPSEKGFIHDGEALLEWLKTNPDIDVARGVFVFGRSLGGAIAIQLANRKPQIVTGVILENTFWDMKEMAISVFAPLIYLSPVLDVLLRHRFNSAGEIRSVHQPIMFISGDADTIVPVSHMTRLVQAAQSSSLRHFVSITNGTHNESWMMYPNQYYPAVQAFMDEAVTGPLAKKREEGSQKQRRGEVDEITAGLKNEEKDTDTKSKICGEVDKPCSPPPVKHFVLGGGGPSKQARVVPKVSHGVVDSIKQIFTNEFNEAKKEL